MTMTFGIKPGDEVEITDHSTNVMTRETICDCCRSDEKPRGVLITIATTRDFKSDTHYWIKFRYSQPMLGAIRGPAHKSKANQFSRVAFAFQME
jgi:hypothetical protein